MSNRYASCIFCDDIRHELGNKASFMGVYGAELIVGNFPVVLPRLCMSVYVVSFYNDPIETLRLDIRYGEEFFQEFVVPTDVMNEAHRSISSSIDEELATFAGDELPKMRVNGHLIVSPFEIKAGGRLIVHAHTERESFRAGSLRIRQADLTSLPDGKV